MYLLMVFAADIQRTTQVGEIFGGDIQCIGDRHGAHEAPVIDDDRPLEQGGGRVHAMFGSGILVEVVQGAVQQRACSPVDGLAAVDGVGRFDLAGIDEVGVAHVQVKPESLLDGFGECLGGVRFQGWKLFEQLVHLHLVLAVTCVLFLPCLGDFRLLLDCRRQPGRGLMPVAHRALGFWRSLLEPGGDSALDGGVMNTRYGSDCSWHDEALA